MSVQYQYTIRNESKSAHTFRSFTKLNSKARLFLIKDSKIHSILFLNNNTNVYSYMYFGIYTAIKTSTCAVT